MPAASFVGKQVRDLYPQNPEIAELHAARDRELWERPGAQSYPTQIVTPDGRRRDTIYYKATYPAEGEPQGLVGAIFDVTARARAESALRESEERFRAVVDSANEGMLIYDRSLNIIAGNRAAERIVGLPLAQLIGKPGFTSLLPCVRADGTPLPEAERPTRATRAQRPGADRPAHRHPARRRRGDLALGEHRVPAPRRRHRLLRPGLDHHRRHRADQRRGAAEGERGALPAHLRARRLRHGAHRHGPALHPRQPAPVRHPRLPRGGAAASSPAARSRIPTTSTSSTSSARRCTRARSTRCAWRSATCARTARWSG